jgi:hypothetical protein
MQTQMVHPAGFMIRCGKKPPATNVLRATLNSFLEQPIFKVNHDDIVARGTTYTVKRRETLVERLTKKDQCRNDDIKLFQQCVEKHRLSPQGSCKESPVKKPEDGGTILWVWKDINLQNTKTIIVAREGRKYGRRGRNDRYKDRSGLTATF